MSSLDRYWQECEKISLKIKTNEFVFQLVRVKFNDNDANQISEMVAFFEEMLYGQCVVGSLYSPFWWQKDTQELVTSTNVKYIVENAKKGLVGWFGNNSRKQVSYYIHLRI